MLQELMIHFWKHTFLLFWLLKWFFWSGLTMYQCFQLVSFPRDAVDFSQSLSKIFPQSIFQFINSCVSLLEWTCKPSFCTPKPTVSKSSSWQECEWTCGRLALSWDCWAPAPSWFYRNRCKFTEPAVFGCHSNLILDAEDRNVNSETLRN